MTREISDINILKNFCEKFCGILEKHCKYLRTEKDMEDAKHLRLVFSDNIDEAEINRMKHIIRKERMD